MTVEDYKAIACQLTKLLDHDDVEKIMELLAPNFISHFAGIPIPLNREQYIQVNRAAKKAFSDLHRSVDDVVAEGDKVVVRITARGTHTGMFQGSVATGRITKISGIAIRRFDGEKIAEEWVVNDQLGLIQQLGLFKMPATLERSEEG